jgi:hypothetical protein
MIEEATNSTCLHHVAHEVIDANSFLISPTSMSERGLGCRTKRKTRQPAVVIELMSATDKLEALQAKVTKFVNAGTREGVAVDTRRDQVWIHNRNQQPYFDALAPELNSTRGRDLPWIALRYAMHGHELV